MDLLTISRKLPGKRILVVGDLMLDEYIWGDVRRISQEAPVPVLQKKRISYRPGGAANVAANVCAMEGIPVLIGVVGEDTMAKQLSSTLQELGILDACCLIASSERPTTVKSRIMGHNQQMLRIDTESLAPISTAVEEAILERCQSMASDIDAILLSDYAKGVLTPRLCREIIAFANHHAIPVVVDPKGRDFAKYASATVVTPNTIETIIATDRGGDDVFDLDQAVCFLRTRLAGSDLLITQGAEGMMLFYASGGSVHIPATARNVFDVTGAGDTVAATLALGVAAGLGVEAAARLATVAAGIVVGKLGTSTVTHSEFLARLNHFS